MELHVKLFHKVTVNIRRLDDKTGEERVIIEFLNENIEYDDGRYVELASPDANIFSKRLDTCYFWSRC